MTDATLRRLPLHDAHAAAGARFAPFAGYEMPVRYGSIKDEHQAVRQRVGLFDVSHMGEVFVRGRDAVAAVSRLVTNDVAGLRDGGALYTVMCNHEGGIVDDLIVYRLGPEEVLICVNAANRAKDVAWIRTQIEGDVEVSDESDAFVQLAVQGPMALAVVGSALGAAASAVRPFNAAALPFGGAEILVARTGYTGEDGVEVYARIEVAQALFDALRREGESAAMAMVGLGARDTLRLEARLLLYGNDIDETTNPFEAGVGWVVKLEKGDFIGREALSAIKAHGVVRRLRGLLLVGPGVMRRGYPVYSGNARVGETTSGGVAPSLDDRSIALAYIATEHADRERLEVEIRGKRVAVETTKRPFYTRTK